MIAARFSDTRFTTGHVYHGLVDVGHDAVDMRMRSSAPASAQIAVGETVQGVLAQQLFLVDLDPGGLRLDNASCSALPSAALR